MYTHQTEVRVRYGDTDQMGYVYYGNYPYYYEVARAEAIRTLGYPYREIEAEGVLMPITRMQIKYIGPARYDELLKIQVDIPELPGRLIRFDYRIYNEAGLKINEGHTELAFVKQADSRPTRCPQKLTDLLIPFFKGQS